MMQKSLGLTLIEVLIALAIMGIALTAIIKASTQTISQTSYLQDKMIASWVGTKILNDVRAGVIIPAHEQEKTAMKVTMLGRDWYYRLVKTDTPNMRIKKIVVGIYTTAADAEDEDNNGLMNLETFIYQNEENHAKAYE